MKLEALLIATIWIASCTLQGYIVAVLVAPLILEGKTNSLPFVIVTFLPIILAYWATKWIISSNDEIVDQNDDEDLPEVFA